ncbi:hypothetical protein [Enterococcus sp. AZ109]|uniref:hypothetical protein n=1 Tax=Enterococcus sp. AZ109 TaxID=2774634 RepID=UPI003F20EE0D
MKTLIVLFHPSIATSTVNRRLIKAAEETKKIKIRDMYQLTSEEIAQLEELADQTKVNTLRNWEKTMA